MNLVNLVNLVATLKVQRLVTEPTVTLQTRVLKVVVKVYNVHTYMQHAKANQHNLIINKLFNILLIILFMRNAYNIKSPLLEAPSKVHEKNEQ